MQVLMKFTSTKMVSVKRVLHAIRLSIVIALTAIMEIPLLSTDVQTFSLSINMDKFNTNQFPAVKPAPKSKRKVLLKDGQSVTEPGVKERHSSDGLPGVGAAGKGGAGTSSGRVAERRPPKRQQKTTETERIDRAKRASLQERSKQVNLPDPEYPPSGIFTPKFVFKDGQLLMNSQRPSTDKKSACNIMDCLYTDAELTALSEKSDTDVEDSCSHALFQGVLYAHGLKQRVVYYRQQSDTLEKQRSALKVEMEKMKKEKEKFEKEVDQLARERNRLTDELRLKMDAFNTLNTAMEKLKADQDQDIADAKEAAKAELMKDYWVRVAEAYRMGFHDGGQRDPYDRYFENPEEYDAKANTLSVLPSLPEVQEGGTDEETPADPGADQVYMENYIRDFVDNLLYDVACILIDEIVDQVMAEDNDEDEDGSRLERRSKRKSDREVQASGVVGSNQAADGLTVEMNQVAENYSSTQNPIVVADETSVIHSSKRTPPTTGA